MEPKQSKENALFEWYDSLVFALAVIVLFFVFAVRIITVSGVSMQPTLYGGDRVAVQSMLYTPQRGDVVVVDGYINYGDPLVKRIIARVRRGRGGPRPVVRPGVRGCCYSGPRSSGGRRKRFQKAFGKKEGAAVSADH